MNNRERYVELRRALDDAREASQGAVGSEIHEGRLRRTYGDYLGRVNQTTGVHTSAVENVLGAERRLHAFLDWWEREDRADYYSWAHGRS